ncbi:MAG: SWIM zinc finger domain-containing protein [Elusimicrobiota bacterium]|nr:SWIM zinc finger domain-containing protein [Elusimicrobiota bacterium]
MLTKKIAIQKLNDLSIRELVVLSSILFPIVYHKKKKSFFNYNNFPIKSIKNLIETEIIQSLESDILEKLEYANLSRLFEIAKNLKIKVNTDETKKAKILKILSENLEKFKNIKNKIFVLFPNENIQNDYLDIYVALFKNFDYTGLCYDCYCKKANIQLNPDEYISRTNFDTYIYTKDPFSQCQNKYFDTNLDWVKCYNYQTIWVHKDINNGKVAGYSIDYEKNFQPIVHIPEQNEVKKEVKKNIATEITGNKIEAPEIRNTNFFLKDNYPDYDELHNDESQRERQIRALDIKKEKITFIDKTTALIKGSKKNTYKTTLNDCSCRDFVFYSLPCKHMYRLAHELKLFKLPPQKIGIIEKGETIYYDVDIETGEIISRSNDNLTNIDKNSLSTNSPIDDLPNFFSKKDYPDFSILHFSEKQRTKQLEALKIKDYSILHLTDTFARIKDGGKVYKATLKNCACQDFALNSLPCKHMYKLADKLGIFKLSTVKKYQNISLESKFHFLENLKEQLLAIQKNPIPTKLPLVAIIWVDFAKLIIITVGWLLYLFIYIILHIFRSK